MYLRIILVLSKIRGYRPSSARHATPVRRSERCENLFGNNIKHVMASKQLDLLYYSPDSSQDSLHDTWKRGRIFTAWYAPAWKKEFKPFVG